MKFRIIRSKRTTLALEIKDEEIIVRAPQGASVREIDAFVNSHKDWIEKRITKMKEAKRQALERPLSEDEINQLVEKAKQYIPERVAYYAPIIGVSYGKVTIRKQKTRWGSCSARGDLNFNCLLMLTPPEVIDSVVVHELCHRKEMNHSRKFYGEVLRAFPDYRKWDKWLKDNGRMLLMRAQG